MTEEENEQQTQRMSDFFTSLGERRKEFEDEYALKAPEQAPSFNCFHFIRPDELRLSEILAVLLNPDPKGVHAQGDAFLRLFFSAINIKYPDCTDTINVKCEAPTDKLENKMRRIDIEVDFAGQFGLAIENKPWAGDQTGQLKDYAKQLKEKYRDKSWYLIYLSGDDSDPSVASLPEETCLDLSKNGLYQKINFGHIVRWLENCETLCQSDHVRHFLRDFIAYCKNEFLGESDMIDAKVITNVCIENDTNLELALAVGQQVVAIKRKLLQNLIETLRDKFSKSGCYLTYELNGFNEPKKIENEQINLNSWDTRRFVIRLKDNSWSKFSLAIEFNEKYEPKLAWGILSDDDCSKLQDPLASNLIGKFNDGYWDKPWLCKKSPDKNLAVDNNIQPWLKIQSEKVTGSIVRDIIELKTFIEEAKNQLFQNSGK